MKLIGCFITADKNLIDTPLAASGHGSFRLKIDSGYIMIGARTRDDALDVAFKQDEFVEPNNLEVYSGSCYTPVYPKEFKKLQPGQFKKLMVHRPRKGLTMHDPDKTLIIRQDVRPQIGDRRHRRASGISVTQWINSTGRFAAITLAAFARRVNRISETMQHQR